MTANLKKALEVFNNIPIPLRAPSLHPAYILADALRDPDLSPEFFIYERGEQYFYHAVELARIPGSSAFDIRSPYGYGGPIASTEDREFLKQAWASYFEWCHEKNVVAELIRFHPILENWKFYHSDAFFNRETVAVDLRSADVAATYLVRARTAVRKALKNGLSIRWETKEKFIEPFLKIYEESLKFLKASSFYFFPRPYYQKLLDSPLAQMVFCLKEGDIVGGAIFLVEGNKMEYHLSASTPQGRALGATNLLLHEAFLRGKNLGCDVCHLGGGTNQEPANPLLFFKQGFSNLKFQFRLGERVHNLAVYENLKVDWVKAHGNPGPRVLFYR